LLVSLLVLAATLALSYVFPQASAYVRSDPISYEDWLAGVQVLYRRWTPLLRTIGLFHIRDTPWFRALLAFLGLFLLLSIGDRVGALANEWRTRQPEAFYARRGAHLMVDLTLDDAEHRLARAFNDLGMAVRRRNDGETTYLRAHRRAWACTDALLGLLGALCMVAALGVNGRWGWFQPGVQVLPGQTVPVGPHGDRRLELIPGTEGSRGAWVEVDGSTRVFVDRERGALSGPLHYELTGRGGPLVTVSASSQGESLALAEYTLRPEPQSELQLAFSAASEEQAVRLFILPEAKTVVRLEWRNEQGDAAGPPRFQQWAFEQGAQQLVGTAEIEAVDGAATTHIGQVTYQWVISSYAVLDLAYRPGGWLLGAGALLALLGVIAHFVPRQQVWARIRAAEKGTLVTLCKQDGSASPSQAARAAILGALGVEAEHRVWS
jgi:hypothetical protein